MQIAFDAGHARGEGRIKAPAPAQMLDDRCLVKWETSDPENEQGRAVLEIARELIAIANRELRIAKLPKIENRKSEIENPPVVLDPFAGGGAIPLEATRLGCQAIANDYNPVAYLILRATCEFPQKFVKPGKRDERRMTNDQSQLSSSVLRPSSERLVDNVLAYDVEYWAKWILERAREKIGHLYPAGKDGKPVVGYLWARTAPCSNPTCRAEIPLLRSLLICNKEGKRVALTMRKSKGKVIEFGIAKGKEIKETAGTMIEKGRGAARCPICQQTTPVEDLRRAGLEGKMGERMVAVITDTPQGKDYRAVEPSDETAFEKAKKLAETVERPAEKIYENIVGIPSTSIISPALYYGMPRWGDLFNPRQLVAMQTLA